jgi:hypothetical protein
MFSDRLWILKAAAALGLLAWLCHDGRRALRESHPDLERVVLYSEQLRGRLLSVSNREVVSVDSTGVRIMTEVGPMHLRTAEKLAVGQTISAIVRPIGPRQLEVLRLGINEGFGWKRALTYIVSVLTVMAYFWLVRRRFRWSPEAGVFRSRY